MKRDTDIDVFRKLLRKARTFSQLSSEYAGRRVVCRSHAQKTRDGRSLFASHTESRREKTKLEGVGTEPSGSGLSTDHPWYTFGVNAFVLQVYPCRTKNLLVRHAAQTLPPNHFKPLYDLRIPTITIHVTCKVQFSDSHFMITALSGELDEE